MANVIESGEDAIQFRTPSIAKSRPHSANADAAPETIKTSDPTFPSVSAPLRKFAGLDRKFNGFFKSTSNGK